MIHIAVRTYSVCNSIIQIYIYIYIYIRVYIRIYIYIYIYVYTVGAIKKFTVRYKKRSLNDSNIIVNEAKYFNDL